jgi:DNA-directed RNA polymerase alpha subunit
MESTKRIRWNDLHWSKRASTALKKLNIEYLDELSTYTAIYLMGLDNFGNKTLKEVRHVLMQNGYYLSGENSKENIIERVNNIAIKVFKYVRAI